jgi:DNA-binding CsgD family transcriptional regulator
MDQLSQIASGTASLESVADTVRQQRPNRPAAPDAERSRRQPICLKSPTAGLSCREQEVLKLLADDRSTQDIALTLGITVGTLRRHLAKIYRILKVKNRAAAVATILPLYPSGPRIMKSLSPREQEVLRLLADDKSTGDIARNLGVAMSTLRNHLINIYQRLRVRNRQEAVALFRRDASTPDGMSPSSALPPPVPEALSPREQEALKLLAKDQSRADIALSLDITEGTLSGLLSDVYRKLGVKNRQDAVATTRPSSAQLSTIPTRLSLREQEVLKLLAEEQSTKDIARNLNISSGTIFVYTSNICRILGVKSREEAVSQFRNENVSVTSFEYGADG